MPYPGGDADKFGQSYEAAWSVNAILDLLTEKICFLRIEQPSSEEQKIEFERTLSTGVKEGYQIKRQFKSEGNWTIETLLSKGVIQAFLLGLSSDSSTRTFVSSDPAPVLRELAERARKADDYADFKAACGDEFESVFNRIMKACKEVDKKTTKPKYPDLINLDEQTIFNRLSRIFVAVCDEDSLKSVVLDRIEFVVEGAPTKTIYDALTNFALVTRTTITAASITGFLKEQHNLHLRSWDKDDRGITAIDQAYKRYKDRIDHLLKAQGYIEKPEVDEILALLPESKILSLTGVGGVGKSTSASTICSKLKSDGWTVLPVRIDITGVGNTSELGTRILDGLRVSPAFLLDRMSQAGKGLLVIDQIDAISYSSMTDREGLLSTVSALISEAQALANVKVLVVCREFDFEHDHQLRGLLTNSRQIKSDLCSPESIKRYLKIARIQVSDSQLELLRLPFNLFMLASLRKDYTASAFTSTTDLCDLFWESKSAQCARVTHSTSEWIAVIDTMLSYMSEHSTKEVPREVLDAFAGSVSIMASENVVACVGSSYSFFHDSFAEYCKGRRFTGHGKRLLTALTEGIQPLSARSLVKSVLQYQRARYLDMYAKEISALFDSALIRNHLKQFIFFLLETEAQPHSEEVRILKQLLISERLFLRTEAFRIFYAQPNWAVELNRIAGIAELLASNNEYGARFLYSLAPLKTAETINLLQDYQEEISKLWPEARFYSLLRFNTITDQSIDYLFRQFGSRPPKDKEDVESFWRVSEAWSRHSPFKALKCIADITQLILFEQRKISESELGLFRAETHFSIATAVKSLTGSPRILVSDKPSIPRDRREISIRFVEAIFPIIMNLIGQFKKQDTLTYHRDSIWGDHIDAKSDQLLDVLFISVAKILRMIAAFYPKMAESYISDLMSAKSRTCEYILLEMFDAGGVTFADQAAAHFQNSPEIWTVNPLGAEDDYFGLAARFLKSISPHCTMDNFRAIEQRITETDFGPATKGKKILLSALDSTRRADTSNQIVSEGIIQQTALTLPVFDDSESYWADALSEKSPVQLSMNCDSFNSTKMQLDALLSLLQLLPESADQAHAAITNQLLKFQLNKDQFEVLLDKVQPRRASIVARPFCRLLINHRNDFPNRAVELVKGYIYEVQFPELSYQLMPDSIQSAIESSGKAWAFKALANLGWIDSKLLAELKTAFEKETKPLYLLIAGLTLLQAIAKWDGDSALTLFMDSFKDLSWELQLLILQSPECEGFLLTLVRNASIKCSELIELLFAKNDPGPLLAAKMATVGVLKHESLIGFFQKAMSHSSESRKGVAWVLMGALDQIPNSSQLAQAFKTLLEEHAAYMFQTLSTYWGKTIPDWLIEDMTDCSKFLEHSNSLLEVLSRQNDSVTKSGIAAMKKIIENISSKHQPQPMLLLTLLLRHTGAVQDQKEQASALDLIDLLIEKGLIVHELRNLLLETDIHPAA